MDDADGVNAPAKDCEHGDNERTELGEDATEDGMSSCESSLV